MSVPTAEVSGAILAASVFLHSADPARIRRHVLSRGGRLVRDDEIRFALAVDAILLANFGPARTAANDQFKAFKEPIGNTGVTVPKERRKR